MKMFVAAVFDNKVGAFATPFFCRSRGEAVRSFQDACNDEKLPFKRHAGDYALWYVASFDDSNAEFVCAPEVLCRASDFVVDN